MSEGPSVGVPPLLLPHVHLISTHRYPQPPHLSVETALDYLLYAPNVVKGHAPMLWTFLETPQDGTIMLVWQPSKLGNQFASDGYIWADPEMGHTLNVRSCNVEVLVHQSGFAPGRETMTMHSRRRYRVTASSDPNATIDPSLWLVHYSACEPNARIPTSRITMSPQIQQLLSTRRQLQHHGQIIRREFMLHDQANWPTISMPGGPPAIQGGIPQGNNQFGPGGRPGNPYFAPQHPGQMAGPSPAKRQRQVGPAHTSAAAMSIPPGAIRDPSIDDDEDVSRGDLLDHLTPREISVMRYKQHHEWMEEILSSPYDINQIQPVSLGLGLSGDLGEITKDFFEVPPSDPDSDILVKPVAYPVGALATREGQFTPEKAQAFQKLAEEKIAALTDDMKQMKKQHAARMNKLHSVTTYSDGELTLRHAVYDSSRDSPEFWEEKDDATKSADGKHGTTSETGRKTLVDSVVGTIEEHVGKRVGRSLPVRQVQKGGLQDAPVVEPMPEPQLDVEEDPLEDDFDPTSSLHMDHFDGPTPTVANEADASESHPPEDSAHIGFDDVQMPDMADGELVGSTDLTADFAINGPDTFETENTVPSGNGNNGAGSADGDIDMHNSAAGLLDQYYTSEPSSPAQNLSTPQAQSSLNHSEVVNTSTSGFNSTANPQENAKPPDETIVQQGPSTDGA